MNETRLWPGVVAAALQCLLWLGVAIFAPYDTIYALIGGLLCGLAVLVWWIFFSRAPRLDRWGAPMLILAALLATIPFLDKSIAAAGQGRLFPIYAFPSLSLALVAGALAGRRVALVAAILLASAMWTLVRSDGIMSGGGIQFAWRWTPTPEERLLARTAVEPPPPPVAVPSPSPAVWPGLDRKSVV